MTTTTDERRQRILSTAQEVFADNGYRAADLKTIAQRAGVGKATIYKFFDSKEHLMLTIVEENLACIRDIALQHLISNKPPLLRLEGACCGIAAYMARNREFSRVLIQEAGEFTGEIQRRHLDIVEQYLPVADAFFAELRKDGYFRALNTRETMQLLVDLMIGATYTWALTGASDPVDQAVKYIRILVRGLRDPLPGEDTTLS